MPYHQNSSVKMQQWGGMRNISFSLILRKYDSDNLIFRDQAMLL